MGLVPSTMQAKRFTPIVNANACMSSRKYYLMRILDRPIAMALWLNALMECDADSILTFSPI